MFAVVQCTECRKPRIVDLSTKVSSCPACGNTDTVDDLRIICRTRTQAKARENLVKFTSGSMMIGFDGKAMSGHEKHARRSVDPWSTLEHDYEKARSNDERMDIMAEGLTRIKGEFTEEDVLKLDPERGERLLRTMLERCIVHETKYGHYRT